jgi:CheY-like chemotaxis protein
MPKKILLIENDTAFASQVVESMESSGFDVRVAPEGKTGLDLAREWGPDGIVLCVELPGMSGYLVCQKLRKDDLTRSIPLVLISAEATADTFEKHKALKVRADEYLLKPFVPGTLLDKLAAVGLASEEASAASDDEMVGLGDEMGLESLGAEPSAELPSLDLESLPDEPAPETSATSIDDDLAFLDEAFDGLAAPARPRAAREAPVEEQDLESAADSLLDQDEPGASGGTDELSLTADDPLAGLAEESPSDGLDLEPEPPPRPVRAPSAEALRAAGIPILDEKPDRAPPPPRTTLSGIPVPGSTRTAPAASRPPAVTASIPRPVAAEGTRADPAEAAALRARLEAMAGQVRKAEQELKSARDDARRASAELEAVRTRLAQAERRAEEAVDRAQASDELERELESARTELLVARSEVEGARGEVDSSTADLRKRVNELEAQGAKNEERVLKAYQKIKGDEKVKDKVRKAIAIAAQLLEEGLPAEPGPTTPPEKPRLS